MGKGFSLKGRTRVKECLAFQTPNPLPAVWNAGLRFSTHACPHTHKRVQLSHTLQRDVVPRAPTSTGCGDRSDKET